MSVDRHDITVGDPVIYSLTVRFDTTQNIIGPAIGNQAGAFIVLHDTTMSDGSRLDHQKIYSRQLRLTAFETGDLWIPELSGELVDSLGHTTPWSTDSMNIAVLSVLGEANPDSADLRAIKAQYEAPQYMWMYWAGGGLLLAAALAAWWLWRRRRRDRAEEFERIVPAWEVAFSALETMRQDIDPSFDGGRLWYFRLSEILRRYFDQRYGWSSLDETTSQVLRRLSSAPFDDQHRDRVREFFREADRIRYAKTHARDGRPDIDWEWVREFVEATQQRFEIETDTGNGQQASSTVAPEQSDVEVHA